jgi:tRNA dimethylallyltransferase
LLENNSNSIMALIIIAGATATGKSETAVALAHEMDAEIVNADSMQLYQGMDIGTAKLSQEEREGVPHHLIDILKVHQDSSVAQYQELARTCIDQLLQANHPVIVVGGTGLYIKSILDEMNFPDTEPEVRARIFQEAESIGAEALHRRLFDLDPAAALAIPSANLRRVVRALEVIEITGKPYTANLPREGSLRYPKARQFALAMDRDSLRVRIDRRVELMWEGGFVEEVKNLVGAGILEGKTARAALGYKQILDFAAGDISELEAKEETKRATRQYARRQETWFSRDQRISWLKPDSPRNHALKILSMFKDA